MTDRRKINRRADLTRIGKFDPEDKLAPKNGVHEDLGLIVQSHGRYVQYISPVCPECHSGEIRFDHRGEKVCFDCGWASGQFMAINDKISTGRFNNDEH